MNDTSGDGRTDQLLNDFCEGNLTAAGADELERLADAAPDFFDRCLTHLYVDAALRWEFSAATGLETDGPSLPPAGPNSVSAALATTEAADKGEAMDATALPQITPAPLRVGQSGRPYWRQHPVYFWTLVSALTLMFGAGFFLIWQGPFAGVREPVVDREGRQDSPDADDPDADDVVARITDLYEPIWGADSGQRTVLGAGDRLVLKSGWVRVEATCGAILLLEGPAEFQAESRKAVTLDVGRVAVEVPRRAVGFEIRTRDIRVIDLGTEFGVDVAPSGVVRTEVFSGAVEFRHDKRPELTRRLEAGEAIVFRPLLGTLAAAAPGEAKITRRLPARLTPPLIGYWSFDEKTDAGFPDGSSLANVARPTADDHEIAVVEGRFGQAVEFRKLGRGLQVDNRLPPTFTLSLWIKTDQPSPTGELAYAGAPLLWSDESGPANDFVLSLLNERVWFHDGATEAVLGEQTFVSGATKVTDGQWHHIVLVRDAAAAADGVRIYVDGRLDGSGPAAASSLSANRFVLIGASADVGKNQKPYHGQIDDVAWFVGALNEDEIRSLQRDTADRLDAVEYPDHPGVGP